MKKRPGKRNSEIDYWQSNTDLMTGLVLVLMLIIALLVLYLMQIPETSGLDEQGSNYNADETLGDSLAAWNGDDNDEDYGDDDGGGRGQEWSLTVTPTPTIEAEDDGGGSDEDEEDELYPYRNSGEEWNKAAVYATVVDEETGRAIRVNGLVFELYEEQIQGDGGALRFLNTYYPEKIEYKEYETTEDGSFYLPEKIEEGYYYFKQVTELEGYDLSENVAFEIDDIYDWPDPFIVSIPVSPSRNTIQIQVEDAETHEEITGGTFTVRAAEDIVTADETLRYQTDELADTVKLDENGEAVSKELYLGSYILSQEEIPRYYAAIKGSTEVEVQKKGLTEDTVISYSCEKTRISIQVLDELYTNQKVEGAEFVLTCESNPEFSQEGDTDQNGELVFTNLEKNTTYILQQTGAPEEYQYDEEAETIYVSSDGYIEGETELSLKRTNFIPRVQVEIQDHLLGTPVSDVSAALYQGEELLHTWTSKGEAEIFENLPGGTYSLKIGDREAVEVEITGEQAMESITIRVWTLQNVVLSVAGVLILLLGLVGVIRLIISRRKAGSNPSSNVKEEKTNEK